MKSLFTLLIGLIFAYTVSFSQPCITTVPANALVIKTTGQQNNSDRKYWVCNGSALILLGDRNSIWVDRGGTLSLTGDTNFVFAKENSKVTIAGFGNFVEIDIKVGQAGDYTDNGSFTDRKNCTPMNFDYSVSPTGGCEFWTGVEGITVVKKAKVFPSPARDQLTVIFPKEEIGEYSIQIFDLAGKLVQNKQDSQIVNQIQVDVSALPSGTYTLRIESGNVMVSEQFVVQR